MSVLISFLRSGERGSVAPLYAIAMFALVAIAGVGFDYGRLMTMNSELKNAADQAALAAATQLDGKDGAIARAEAAARNTFASASSSFANETRLANDSKGRAITTLTFRFFDSYVNDQPGAETSSDAEARVVEVVVDGRSVFYALTPVVGVLTSGDITAGAMAKLEEASCRLPPLMVCIDRKDFPLTARAGQGIMLRGMPSNKVDPLAPGNFGFLQLPDEPKSQYELGLNTDYNICRPLTDVMTEPGFRGPETTAINTRFDIYPASSKLQCDTDTGDFCPAEGVRKNKILVETKEIVTNSETPPEPPACGDFDDRSDDWDDEPGVRNFKADDCFSPGGGCLYLGDGKWDIADYFAAHHPGAIPGGLKTRYDVYKWELEDPASRMRPERISSSVESKEIGHSGRYRHTFTSRCAFAQPFAPPVRPVGKQLDRRIITVAEVNCDGLAGRDPVDILGWVDLFLLDAATKAGSDQLGTIATEIIGPAIPPGGTGAFQFYHKSKAVLVR